MSVWALDLCFWGPVTPAVERDNAPARIGLGSQWALPVSCCFGMFCPSPLGILNQATQDVLSGRMGSLCPPPSCLDVSSFLISNDHCTLP